MSEEPVGLIDGLIIAVMPPGQDPTPEEAQAARRQAERRLGQIVISAAGGVRQAADLVRRALEQRALEAWDRGDYHRYVELEIARLGIDAAAALGGAALQVALEKIAQTSVVTEWLNENVKVRIDRKVYAKIGSLSGELSAGGGTDFKGDNFLGVKAGIGGKVAEVGISTKLTFEDTVWDKHPSVTVEGSAMFGGTLGVRAGWVPGKGLGFRGEAGWGPGWSVGVSVNVE